MTRQVNPAGLALIQSFKSCDLTVYADLAGNASVGWGHRTNLPLGTVITQDQADQLFAQDVELAASGVEQAIGGAQVMDNQFAACVSICYNIGVGAFRGSTLAKDIVTGDSASVPAEFLRWSRSGGKQVAGLLRRRKAEAALWAQPDDMGAAA